MLCIEAFLYVMSPDTLAFKAFRISDYSKQGGLPLTVGAD